MRDEVGTLTGKKVPRSQEKETLVNGRRLIRVAKPHRDEDTGSHLTRSFTYTHTCVYGNVCVRPKSLVFRPGTGVGIPRKNGIGKVENLVS